MAVLNDHPILDRESLTQFEAAMTLEQRLPERSVLDVFIGAAARQPERTAITMLTSNRATSTTLSCWAWCGARPTCSPVSADPAPVLPTCCPP